LGSDLALKQGVKVFPALQKTQSVLSALPLLGAAGALRPELPLQPPSSLAAAGLGEVSAQQM